MRGNVIRLHSKWLILLLLGIFIGLLLNACDGVLEQEKYNVSGEVLDTEGEGVEGVTLNFSGGFGSSETDGDGKWSKSGLKGTVVVTPVKAGWNFEPENEEVTGEESEVNFIGKKDDGTTPGEPGEQTSHTAGGVDFKMRLAPAATFPTGFDDDGEATVDDDFWVAETQVTYELWYEVRMWAEDNGYTFENIGREGSHGSTGKAPSGKKNEPVTSVQWYDSIVWCNAISEMLGYDPVYTIDGDILRDSEELTEDDLHGDVMAEDNNGFRLPTSDEWELAARYKGSDSSHGAIEHPEDSGKYWTPGNYASGATADYTNEGATMAAAWYWDNSNVDGSGRKTQDVGQKPEEGNGLGVFDMSGNVWEWCFTQSGSSRVVRGECWQGGAYGLLVGVVHSFHPSYFFFNINGLRLLRTYF